MARAVPFVASLVLLVSGCTTDSQDSNPTDGAGADLQSPQAVETGPVRGGGKVGNAQPIVDSFRVDRRVGDNGGAFRLVFEAQVRDPNAEEDVREFVVAATGAAALLFERKLSPSDLRETSEPPAFGADGWKVWGGTDGRDGVLWTKFEYTFPRLAPAGTYLWVFSASDHSKAVGSSDVLDVRVDAFSLVEVAPQTVLANGQPDAFQGWGNWSATPGQRNVNSGNFLRLANSGDRVDPRLVIDFNEKAFAGASDPSYSVPIDGNIRFAFYEDTTPSTSIPSEGAYQFLPVTPEGSVTIPFTGRGHVIYVEYQLVEIPGVLAVQSYTASFTVTEL